MGAAGARLNRSLDVWRKSIVGSTALRYIVLLSTVTKKGLITVTFAHVRSVCDTEYKQVRPTGP